MDGTLECHFFLASQFHTQADPVYCGQGTLAMVLNALNAEPGSGASGPRGAKWYTETGLDCCRPREEVLTRGISIDTFTCLARCCGTLAHFTRPPPLPVSGPGTPEDDAAAEAQLPVFRAAVQAAARSRSGHVLVASYSREALGQTGSLGIWAEGIHSGHFSPLGGYHAASDSVLIMDVARFKYPPHWVRLADLFRAMRHPDPETGLPRGYVSISASPASLLLHAALGGGEGHVLSRLFAPAEQRGDRPSVAALGSQPGAAPDSLACRCASSGFRCRRQGRTVHEAAAALEAAGLHGGAEGQGSGAGAAVLQWLASLRAAWLAAAPANAASNGGPQPQWHRCDIDLTAPHGDAVAGLLRLLEATAAYAAVRAALAAAPAGLLSARPVAAGCGSAGEPVVVDPTHVVTLLLLARFQSGAGKASPAAGSPAERALAGLAAECATALPLELRALAELWQAAPLELPAAARATRQQAADAAGGPS